MLRNILRGVAECVGLRDATRPVTFHCALACARCGTIIAWLDKPGRMPRGLGARNIVFADIDKEDRLPNAQGVGIHVTYEVNSLIYDYEKRTLAVTFVPFSLHPTLSTETIALFLSLLKAAGWKYNDAEEGAKWADIWTAHQAEKQKGPPACPAHGGMAGVFPIFSQIFGGEPADEEDSDPEIDLTEEQEAPKKRRKTKRRPDEGQGENDPAGS